MPSTVLGTEEYQVSKGRPSAYFDTFNLVGKTDIKQTTSKNYKYFNKQEDKRTRFSEIIRGRPNCSIAIFLYLPTPIQWCELCRI